MGERTEIVIVDDHDLVRKGLRTVLSQHDDLLVVGEAGTVDHAVEVVHASAPDLVLLDLRLADESGVEVARRLQAEASPVKVLVLSAHDSPKHLRDALAAGAVGYLLKNVSGNDLADGIRKAVAGEMVIGPEFVARLLEDATREEAPVEELTGREHEVLTLAANGHSDREIAALLGISPRTAQKHLENVFRKLGVRDRVGAVAAALRRGLLG